LVNGIQLPRVRILETRERNKSRERPVECDRKPPLSASSVTFYQHFSWEFRALLPRIRHQDYFGRKAQVS